MTCRQYVWQTVGCRLFSLWIFIVAVYRGICLCLHCETSSYIFLPFLLCNLMDSGENKRNFGVSRSVGLLLCNRDFREKQTPLRSIYNFRHICTTAIENLGISWNGDPPETQNKDWFVRCWHVRFVLASDHLASRCFVCTAFLFVFMGGGWGWEWGEGAGKIALHNSSLNGPPLTVG